MTTDTLITVVLLLALFGPIIALLERSHRRARGRLDAFSPATRSPRDADLRRTVADLRCLPTGAPSTTGTPTRPFTPAAVTSLSRRIPASGPQAC